MDTRMLADHLVNDDVVYGATQIFDALSDFTRFQLLGALSLGDKSVSELQMVANVSQSAISHQLRLLRDRGLARREILETIRSCGQDLELSEEEREELSAERSWYQENRERVLMLISGTMLVAGLITEHVMGNETRAIPFYVLAAVAGLVFVAPMAFAALKRRTADMNVLMGIAVLGGLIMGFAGDPSVFGDAAIVIFLDQVGEWLEGWSMRKTSGSIKELMELAPELAHVVDGDGTTRTWRTWPSRVEEGERIRVLPGERVPLDGIILNWSLLFQRGAGHRGVGSAGQGRGRRGLCGLAQHDGCGRARGHGRRGLHHAGAHRVDGAGRAGREGSLRELRRPLRRGLHAHRGVLARSWWASVVPLVLSLVGGFSAAVWHDWVYRALSLLVVACPCALVISTPVSFVSALTRAAKNGVLVKGGAYFDIATKVTSRRLRQDRYAHHGQSAGHEVIALGGATEDDVLAIAHALEASSTHPLRVPWSPRADERGHPELEATAWRRSPPTACAARRGA